MHIRSRVLSPESKLEFRAENDINFKDYEARARHRDLGDSPFRDRRDLFTFYSHAAFIF